MKISKKKWINSIRFKTKCPDCGGDLVRSNSNVMSGRGDFGTTFWSKPWKKNKIVAIGEIQPKVFPWACMNCGRVFLYMIQPELKHIHSEYHEVVAESNAQTLKEWEIHP